LTGKDLIALGLPSGPHIGMLLAVLPAAQAELGEPTLREILGRLATDPATFLQHPHFGPAAAALQAQRRPPPYIPRQTPAPLRVWGEGLEPEALQQIKNAASLPVAVSAALMPDAHVGYGLPIGGVLATENCVIPYGVGVDIACRMKLSVYDVPGSDLDRMRDRLVGILNRETLFGTGAAFRTPHAHAVLDADWSSIPAVARVFDRARAQLGSSGSGNHFVEWGVLSLDVPELGLGPGEYLALLSHSGSRGAGAQIASHYSRLAMDLHPELPPELQRLAWLDLDSEPGQEYWTAMNLMGEYAAANHAVIHRKVHRALGAELVAGVENHHNFAWKEQHGERELIVHRKGATPAGVGVLGVIPGSMASDCFVVRGKGSAASLDSASHGAGRVMSRTAAKQRFQWDQVLPVLRERGVQLLSAGIDENPFVYKDIHQVMAQQGDLVEIVARFQPRIVRMAEAGERPED
jgi:tRNA-splicing ligase RtcB